LFVGATDYLSKEKLRGKKGDKNYPTRGSKKEEEKRN
jgi:hypothetical protein